MIDAGARCPRFSLWTAQGEISGGAPVGMAEGSSCYCTKNAIDMDDEILRLNGGVWPDITTKNNVVLPKVLRAVCEMDEVVLFNSYMTVERTRLLALSPNPSLSRNSSNAVESKI